MMEKLFDRILCPTDFSSAANHALRYAERLAKQTGAELILVHAFDRPTTYDLADQSVPADQRTQKLMEEVEITIPGLQVRRILHAGEAKDVIPWVAQEEACDIIVMGTHGRTGLAHVLLGSVGEHVLRHTPCPVLMVREKTVHEPALAEPCVQPLPPPSLM